MGVDIDPDLVAESREKARLAGVEDRVRFVRQNFFETDVREATVVLIYLLPEINLRLRPKLIGEMKPARAWSPRLRHGGVAAGRALEDRAAERVFLGHPLPT